MTQTTIFDPPKARRCDPITSQQSASEIRSKLARLKQAVCDVVNASGESLTANEIAAIAVRRAYVTEVAESIRKRVAECARAGLIAFGEIRECSVTGKKCRTFGRIGS